MPKYLDKLPGRVRLPNSYDLLADELKSHPGKWMEVTRHRKGISEAGRVKGLLLTRGPGFEVSQRTIDGEVIIYARWTDV